MLQHYRIANSVALLIMVNDVLTATGTQDSKDFTHSFWLTPESGFVAKFRNPYLELNTNQLC